MNDVTIDKIKTLPVLPQVALKISERMQSASVTSQEIAELLQTDVGLTSKILRLANSSYYSIPGGVTDVSKALQYLGFTTISQIVLTVSVLSAFKSTGTNEFPLEQFWKHSFGVGLASEIAARSLGVPHHKEMFTAGLLHDIGKLILLEVQPDQLGKILIYTREHQVSFYEAEKALQLTPHTALGEYLAKHWGLPPRIAACVEHHHDSTFVSDNLLLIAWANQWVHLQDISNGTGGSPQAEALEQSLATKLKFTTQQKEHIKNRFIEDFKKSGAILSGRT